MNKETRDGLKTNIDAMKNVLNGATAPDAEYIARLMFSLNTWEAIAEAERLLDEGLAPPSRYARVHLMGHTTHVGEVEPLPGGALRLNAIDSSHDRGVFRYVIDAEQRGRHSVEWISEADWKAHVDAVERDADCPLHGATSKHAPDDDSDVPSDATAEAPAAESDERLAAQLTDLQEAARDARDYVMEARDELAGSKRLDVAVEVLELAYDRLEAMGLGDGDPDRMAGATEPDGVLLEHMYGPSSPGQLTLYVLQTEDENRTPESAREEFRGQSPHRISVRAGEGAEVRAACKVWSFIEDYHTDGETAFFLVARSAAGDGLVLVETCVGVDITYGGEITAFDALSDDEYAPPVMRGETGDADDLGDEEDPDA